MITFVLIVPPEKSGEWIFNQIARMGPTQFRSVKCCQIESDGLWLRIEEVADHGEIAPRYDEKLAKISDAPGKLVLYSIETGTRDTCFLRSYIQNLPSDRGILIDNDHGWIASVSEYQAAIVAEADWLHASGRGAATTQGNT